MIRQLALMAMIFGLVTSEIAIVASPASSSIPACGAVELSGGNWLGGSGVDVRANTQTYNGTLQNWGPNDCANPAEVYDLNSTPPQYGDGWQCVELINRLYMTEGWITSYWYGDGNELVDNLPSGLSKQNNGSITAIVPGDVVTLDGPSSDPAGHAAVVNSVTSNGDGTYAIQIVNQNAPTVLGSATWNPSTKMLTPEYSGYTTQAVIHAAANTNSSSGSSGSGFTIGNSINWPGMTYTGSNTLTDGQYLNPGQYMLSQNGQFALAMSSDGNVALYSGSQTPLWSTNTSPGSTSAFVLQSDGNVVLYGPDNSVQWQSSTSGNSGDSLVVQNDGNVVLTSWNGVAIWASNTGGNGFPMNDTGTDTLADGQSLGTDYDLVSADGRFHLVEEVNGDLVEYGPGYSLMWHSDTAGNPGAVLTLQSSDGNLVLYATNGVPVWNSDTAGNTGDALVLQNDGNVVLYSWNGVAIWASNS